MDHVSDRVRFTCNGRAVELDAVDGESLLVVLREGLGWDSVKDGCAPQGQCGCCTVLVDGEPRVACVTPVTRVAGRAVTTLEGLPAGVRDDLAARFVATGGSQCGFCTPGILVRAAALRAKGKTTRTDVDRALAAHLCRCTGWQTVYEAIAPGGPPVAPAPRDERAAAARAELEGGTAQRVSPAVPQGHGGFADDRAPRDALVAVPLPPGGTAESIEAAGIRWVVAETLLEARGRAGKVQGRRTTADTRPALELPGLPDGGVRLATSWVEPAYLEPDASWCEPGGEPASPLANGGAFGGKLDSPVGPAARELAGRLGRTVRTVFSREDVVRLGPKRPPVALSAVVDGPRVRVTGHAAGAAPGPSTGWPCPYRVDVDASIAAVAVAGPPASPALRAPFAELHVLLEGALDAAGVDRTDAIADARGARVLLDTVAAAGDARAGARVRIDDATGRIEGVDVWVAAGDPLDEVVLRSYAVGAAHMALGWVFSEGLAVDPDTGEVHDLTIRSFGIVPARNVPPIEVAIVDEPGPPIARSSDAVFAAVASAAWNAVARADGERPEAFPALGTRASRMLRA